MSVNRFPIAGTNGSQLRQLLRKSSTYYNVEDYGAVHDVVLDVNNDIVSGTDDTSKIQDAIADCWANGGGIIFFPAGIYRISGALKTSIDGQNPNCQIYIPSNNNSAPAKSIMFLGEYAPSFFTSVINTYPIPVNSVILYSDISGSGTLPAVIGGKNGVVSFGKYFINGSIFFENINVRVKAVASTSGPTISGINGENYSNLATNNVRIDTSVTPTLTVAPSVETFGIRSPQNDMNMISRFDNTLVTGGFKYGGVFSEKACGNNFLVWGCSNGMAFSAINHCSHFDRVDLEGCINGICPAPASMNPGNAYFSISSLDMEMGSYLSGTAWYNSVKSINDPSNVLYGKLTYAMVEGFFGPNQSKFSKTGGTNLVCTALY